MIQSILAIPATIMLSFHQLKMNEVANKLKIKVVETVKQKLLENPFIEVEFIDFIEVVNYFSDERIKRVTKVAITILTDDVCACFIPSIPESLRGRGGAIEKHLEKFTEDLEPEIKGILFSQKYVEALSKKHQNLTEIKIWSVLKMMTAKDHGIDLTTIPTIKKAKESLISKELDSYFEEEKSPWKDYESFTASMRQFVKTNQPKELDSYFEEENSPWKDYESFTASMRQFADANRSKEQ